LSDEGLMKMRELVAVSGVTKQTIHFYLHEGLLSPPVKTSRNMAYYDHRHVEEIRLIKDLQEKRFYPLAVIKMIMAGKREGKDIDATDHLDTIDILFDITENETGEVILTQVEFVEKTGLTLSLIEKLAEIGLIIPSINNNTETFNNYDSALGISIKKLLDLGWGIDDLEIYQQYLQLIRMEAALVHDKIIARQENHLHPPLEDIKRILDNTKQMIAKKAYREFFMEHKHTEDKER